jgi:hypothetical protein
MSVNLGSKLLSRVADDPGSDPETLQCEFIAWNRGRELAGQLNPATPQLVDSIPWDRVLPNWSVLIVHFRIADQPRKDQARLSAGLNR